MESPRPARSRAALAALALGLASCKGGSEPPPPPPPRPAAQPGTIELSAASYAVAEGAGALQLTVTRTGGSDGVVTVQLSTANGSATAPGDYAALSTTIVFAAGDAAPRTVSIAVADDAAFEPSETFTVTLSSPTGGAALGTPSSAVVTIQDDDAPTVGAGRLNDTGVTGCADASANGLSCGVADFPRQDAEGGRDFTANDGRDGRAGFSFTKVDAAGAPLADQAASYATTPWSCVLDRVTGLTWEVRPADGGLRDRGWSYSWFTSDDPAAGTPNAGQCVDHSSCDTEKYAGAVNAAGLCGGSDWRLPSRSELFGLVDLGAASAPLIDTGYFPDALPLRHWSASLDRSGRAWAVDLASGLTVSGAAGNAYAVRLVRGGMQE